MMNEECLIDANQGNALTLTSRYEAIEVLEQASILCIQENVQEKIWLALALLRGLDV